MISLFYVFNHGAVNFKLVESAALVENFEQENTLEVTKFISTRSTEFGTCECLCLLSSIPFCETQGGKATSSVWLHPVSIAIGRRISKSCSVGWGDHTKTQGRSGCIFTHLCDSQLQIIKQLT